MISTLLCLALSGTTLADSPIRFVRTPHLSNDGQLAFSYHGDLWVSGADGSHPRRLTAHVARDHSARFSPDGNWIAFSSNRMGNDDVWVVSPDGGEPRQLTFHTTGDTVLGWTPDGAGVLFATSRGADPWGSPMHVVSLEGGLPEPLAMDRGASGMIRQDGGMVAFNRMGVRYWRKGYKGNANADVWVQDLKSGDIRQLTDVDGDGFREHVQDAHPMWGADGKIYFLSERSGVFNIWRIASSGGDPEQVTFHTEDGVQSPSMRPDGGAIAYENDFEVWRLDVPTGEPVKIPIHLDFDPKQNLVEYLEVDGEADGFAPSPDGERVAVDSHGEIFLVPTDPEYGEKTQLTASPWRDQRETWSPDGEHIAWISDESGEEEIWLAKADGGERKKLTTSSTLKSGLIWSHDSGTLAFTAANGLFTVDLESGDVREHARNPEMGYRLSGFSPDDLWIVYSRSDAELNSDVYLFELSVGEEVNLTRHLARDSGGEITPDGKTLVFTSDRDDGTNHLFAVSLTALTENPDDPLVRERNRDAKKDKKGKQADKKDDEDAEDGAEDDSPQALTVEPEGIELRARQLTRGEEGVSSWFLTADGKSVHYLSDGALHSVGVDGRDGKKLADGRFSRMTPTADRKSIFYRDGDSLKRANASGKDAKTVSFSFRVEVDQRAEWEQVFEEAWRVMKYRFYDEDMHGRDWEAIRTRYKPLLANVGENQDLYDLCNEMIGELNASHTGVSGPPSRAMESQYQTRSLGFEMQPQGEYYRVSHIYDRGPADQEWVQLEEGDYVLAIDGDAILAGDNYFKILNHLLNDYASVTVASPAENGPGTAHGEPRVVRIETVGSTRNLKYEEWVRANREFVEERSGGKIGYVHIRSMNGSSLARFENEIDQYWARNGMVIDIRYNGGGNIDQSLIDILERRPYEYWNYRWGGRAFGRRPRQCIAGPKVMLINWRSASDSEVTPQGFRDLGLGRIVGNPTHGSVIATGSHRLLNGARIRTPGSLVVTYDPSQENNYGINLEGFGVAPDVWVENSPADELAGRDPELATAVDEALKMLADGSWQFGEDK